MRSISRGVAAPPDVLAEFPLQEEPLRGSETRASAAPAAAEVGPEPVATLGARALAFAADVAGASLAVTVALMAAVAWVGRGPRTTGLAWAGAFGALFSLVFVGLPLTLFGRTVGMSLAGLAARPGPSGRGMTPSEASRRWAGTALAAISLGLPLWLGRRDPERPTPADRLSGRTLVREAGS
ncbi:MAG TPA: RDD family protein [Thermoanaerobaculia bacterium]